jgi:hypothetical protein
MCTPVHCRTCGKVTWAGCGAHVDELRAKIPAGEWCHEHDGTSMSTAGTRQAGAPR